MIRLRMAWVISAIFMLLSSSLGGQEPIQLNKAEAALLEYTNKERVSRGLSELAIDVELQKSAREHCLLMIRTEKFEHSSGPGIENIARYYKTVAKAFRGWMTSEKHRENILDPRLESIGVAAFVGENGDAYYIQQFSRSSPLKSIAVPSDRFLIVDKGFVSSYSDLWYYVTKEARRQGRVVAYHTKDMIGKSNMRGIVKIDVLAQKFAIREVKTMARKGGVVKVRLAPGSKLAGVIECSTPDCPTSEKGSKGRVLIADAVAYSPDTNQWYRYRAFRKQRLLGEL